MIKYILILFISGILISCNKQEATVSSINPVNWEKRTTTLNERDSLIDGKTYLSIYSQIYSYTEHRLHNLTVTVSMRNTSETDSIYILNAKYYDTKGELNRIYFDKPIFIKPLETVEIVIDSDDKTGGTGANFIFNWKTKNPKNEPYFEAIMISTLGTQGLSFTTQGKVIRN